MSYDYRYFRKAKFKSDLCETLRQARGSARSRNQAARAAPLLLAETINHPDGGAIISLAGAAIRTGIDLAEIGVFVVEL
jgi:hypothetical protein